MPKTMAVERWEMAAEKMFQARIGGIVIDVPRSVGYYGGIALAVGLEMIEPPLALFIAAVPALKTLTHQALPVAVRAVGDVLVGVAKPVGGDDDAVVRLEDQQKDDGEAIETAKQADRGRELMQQQVHSVSGGASRRARVVSSR
jgi:hypothetical protein